LKGGTLQLNKEFSADKFIKIKVVVPASGSLEVSQSILQIKYNFIFPNIKYSNSS
jgi:hypothetical protein